MSRRKEPKLQVRFKSFHLLDKIEIWANRRGEKLVPWARGALIKQARTESARETIRDAAHFSAFETLVLLREMAGPEASKRAKEHAEKYISKVKADVANELG